MFLSYLDDNIFQRDWLNEIASKSTVSTIEQISILELFLQHCHFLDFFFIGSFLDTFLDSLLVVSTLMAVTLSKKISKK